MNLLLIEKQTGGYFKFTLNGDTANAVTSIQNDLLAVGSQLHFKTGNGANIIKEQFIYPTGVTIISGGTFTFTTVAEVWNKLIEIDYFAWISGGGTGGVDRFDDLLDTFKYTGNAGKAVIVDSSELKLVPITLYNKRYFTELDDTPDALVPNKMVVVDPTGTSLILQDQPTPPEQLLNSVGYFDYDDYATSITPLNAVNNVKLKLTNDTDGANTNTSEPPYGVSYLWDYTTNQFNFSQLSIGDTVDVRVHIQVTTTSINQRIDLTAKFGIGSASQFENSIYSNQYKSSGLHEISFVAPFYIGSNDIKNYPAELYLLTDGTATVTIDGWYIRVIRKNINIITVDYTVPDATLSTKGIVRLAGDLGGTANSPTVPDLANKVSNTRTISTTSPLLGGNSLSTNLTLSIQQANSTQSGYLSFGDWITFNGKANDNAVVHLTGIETITGVKNFYSNDAGIGGITLTNYRTVGNGVLNIDNNSSGRAFVVNNSTAATGTPFTIQKNSVDKLTINDNGEITGNKYTKIGGTSSQFLKADGSVDSSVYLTSAAPVSGSANYIQAQYASAQSANMWITGTGNFQGGVKISAPTAVNGAFQTLGFDAGVYSKAQIRGYSTSTTDAGELAFLTAPNGDVVNERMRIASSGNIGIGVTSPVTRVDVLSGSANSSVAQFSGAVQNRGLRISTFDTGTTDAGVLLNAQSTFQPALVFATNSVEAMRITSAGNLGLGTTSPSGLLHLNLPSGAFGSSSPYQMISYNGSNIYSSYMDSNWNYVNEVIQNGVNQSGYIISTNGLERMRIASTGATTFSNTVTATGFFNSSDARLKDVISKDGDTIEFTWKDKRDDKKHFGYIAQEVQKIYPDQVSEGTDGMLSVNYIEILVKKIQDLENRIKQLEK